MSLESDIYHYLETADMEISDAMLVMTFWNQNHDIKVVKKIIGLLQKKGKITYYNGPGNMKCYRIANLEERWKAFSKNKRKSLK